jgi:DNA gyrase inhibitor GyrI
LEHKTPSQRLRGVHYAVWKWEQSQGQTSATFDQFYQNEMERIIQTMKDRLPEVQYHEH